MLRLQFSRQFDEINYWLLDSFEVIIFQQIEFFREINPPQKEKKKEKEREKKKIYHNFTDVSQKVKSTKFIISPM